ncbi:AfsR/SARP family transcriptional regulator [Stackebrandtia nassauensis]|uniref:AfsR/SARP family transcriptional regulator n=1 Tax=Stackebrandtia nassauensis TaxID=283811 RepID=UPI0001A38861|nr:AfsR/SARP family transcriptional regulator [Stackebrandtia nassauensis]
MTTPQPLRVNVLGPVRAWRGDRELRLGGPRPRAVLAALLLGDGRVLSIDELVDWVWGNDSPTRAEHALRTYVSSLRGEFDRAGTGREVLLWSGGYALRFPGDTIVDVTEFENAVGRAGGGTDPYRAVELLRYAESRFTGTPLCGIGGGTAERVRTQWMERRLTTLEARLSAELDCGRHREALPELLGLMDAHPLRECCHDLAMVALYRCGRQADALAVYQGIRERLADSYGVDPGPRLRRTHLNILRGDRTLDGPETHAIACLSPRTKEPHRCETPRGSPRIRPPRAPPRYPCDRRTGPRWPNPNPHATPTRPRPNRTRRTATSSQPSSSSSTSSAIW